MTGAALRLVERLDHNDRRLLLRWSLSEPHAPATRWFWIGVTSLGVAASVTGFVLDFPNFGQTRETMQQASAVHAISTVLFMTLFLGHLYMGTIGVEGAYGSMRDGVVDETWAKEHHEYWYEEVRARSASGGAPSTAAAAPLKEGWKL